MRQKTHTHTHTHVYRQTYHKLTYRKSKTGTNMYLINKVP